MITIGAQANGYITGQDSTALSSINKGLKDRVKPVIQDAGKKDVEQPPQPLNVQYADQINAFLNFIAKIGSVNGAYPGWDQDAIDAYRNTNNAFVEYDQYLATSTAQKLDPKKPIGSPTIGFLPFDLTLTIDGLSGMKVYQKYIIDTDFLPSNYPSSLEFLIKGITHTIQNNQWITTLESVAIPKNPFGMKNAQGQTYKGSPSTVGGRPVGVAAETGQALRGNNFSPSSTPISKGPQADYWSLVAIAAAENFVNNPQGMADVAQSIYNRLNAGGYGKSIKSIVVAAGQYEPTFRNPGDWKAIKDKNTAIKAYQNSKGVSLAVATSAIETSEKALKNPTYKASAKTFIGSRTEFLASRPNSSSAVGIVERNPINLNNAFFWNYNGKIQFYNKKILVAQNPPSNIPNLV
jgi:hypothetical protein